MNKQELPSLDEQINNMAREKNPSRDLWQGIEYAIDLPTQKIAPTKSNRKLPIYGLAASICVMALVGYFSFQTGVNTTGQELVNQLSAQHSEQKQALLSSLAGQQSTTQNWQQQLEELDEAAVAIKTALKNEPNNAALLKMLKRVHEQQIALIERVHAPAWQRI